MAKKTQLNKNLIAGLTVSAAVVVVGVVAVATINAAERNPEVYADKARAAERSGDLGRAYDLFKRAFNQRKEATYLIEAARVAYLRGEIIDTLGALNQAHKQSPNDPAVLNALLERYWELRWVQEQLGQWEEVLQYADTLLTIEEKNLLAMVSRVEALDALSGLHPGYAEQAAETMARAAEIDSTDARVALLLGLRALRDGRNLARDAAQRNRMDEVLATLAESRNKAIELMLPASDKHPENPELTAMLVQLLADAERPEDASRVITRCLETQPGNPEMLFADARFRLREALRLQDAGEGEAAAEHARIGIERVDKTIEHEPAMYAAYAIRADLLQVLWRHEGRWEQERAACEKEILESFVNGLARTVNLRSVRAVFGNEGRAQLITQAFDFAMNAYQRGADPQDRAVGLEYARKFLSEAQTRFPESWLVPLMEGQFALLREDTRVAIQCFLKADEKMGPLATTYAMFVKEQLARLYLRDEQIGLSLRFTDQVIQIARARGEEPSRWVTLNRAQLLNATGKSDEALDLLDSVASKFEGDPQYAEVRARVLTMKGRDTEAVAELQAAGGEQSVSTIVTEARIHAVAGRLDEAERALREALSRSPTDQTALQLFSAVMINAKRQEAAAEFVRDLAGKASSDDAKRILRVYALMFTETDPDERDRKVLEIIAEIPDAEQRAGELYQFWASRGEFERAVQYLDELERIKGLTPEITQMRFECALRLKQWQRAEEMAVKLAAQNADLAHGAVYRGHLALMRDPSDPEKALSEFRTAERELPNSADLRVAIAQALMAARDTNNLPAPRYDEAIAELKIAVEYDPRNFHAHRLLYVCYEESGRRQEGIPYLERAAQLNPQDEFIRARAQLLEEEKDPKAGIAWREPLRESEPQNADNLLRLVQLYARLGNFELAEARLAEAAALVPAADALLQTGALYYAERNDRAKGEPFLRNIVAAREKAGAKAAAMVTLARFLEKLGFLDEALTTLKEVEQLVNTMPDDDAKLKTRLRAAAQNELADYYGRRRDFEPMIAAVRAALAIIDPTEGGALQTTRLKLLRAFLSARKYGEFEQEIAKYVAEFPKDTRGLSLRAEYLAARADLEGANEVLTQILTDDPDNIWALYLRGRLLVALRKFNLARADLLRVKDTAPTAFDMGPRVELAKLYEIEEQLPLAEAELRELYKEAPDDPRFVNELIAFFQRTAQYGRALEIVNEMTARLPEDPVWHYKLGQLRISANEFTSAIRPLARAAELTERKNPAVVADWLLAMTRGNRAEDALRAFATLPPEVLTPQIKAYAAEAHHQMKQPLEGNVLFAQAMSDAASRALLVDLLFVVGRAVAANGETEGVGILRRTLEQAAQGTLEQNILRTALAHYLLQSGDNARRAEARQIAEGQIASAEPGSPVHLQAMLIRAQAQEQLGEIEGAIKTYEEILGLKADLLTALNNIAYLLADKSTRPQDALPYADEARRLAPNNANVLDTVAWAYYRNDKLDAAETLLLEAVRLEPNSLGPRYHLGRVFQSARRTGEARRAYERVIETGRNTPNDEYVVLAKEALANLR